MTIKDGDCKSCEHFVKDAYGQFVCEFDGECENMVREITNEEYIRSCSAEELAVLLYKIGFYSNITDDVMNTALMENIPTEKAFELWLKEIHHG